MEKTVWKRGKTICFGYAFNFLQVDSVCAFAYGKIV